MTVLAPPPSSLLTDASLFLDFDGTLVEIADTPDGVAVGAEVAPLLMRLADRLSGRVAIVTGRPVREVRALIAPATLPVAGSHGLEIAAVDGHIESPERPAALDAALARAHAFATAHPGLLVEDKPFGIGLHYRRAPDAAQAVAELAEQLAAAHDLHVQHGKMVAELRLPGRDKGAAMTLLMTEPERRRTVPVFVGDDVTDEAGFAAAAAMGGAGVLVGPPRDTAATYRVDSVADALVWLDQACREVT
ncbi:trehalose-phosphatase [Sphingomonas endophytica]|uniref:Trehalose 6-phosphate phosphatase n=1 Tax=Sphingomonas endophytica TaxID=869719 RepID=A0A147I0W0_9SPHN|nr:trehalose-phosphatase [Sphingomonas endophytica]KTT71094.1 haloacid dehalogenase [Sphingomonas endophytica]